MPTGFLRGFALVLGFALAAGCADDLSGETGELTTTTTAATTAMAETTGTVGTTGTGTAAAEATAGTTTGPGIDAGLCGRLGEIAGAETLAAAIAEEVRGDDRINAYFLNAGVDAERFVSCLGDQLATMAGCAGATYTCAGMMAVHAGLGVSAIDLADFVADVAAALDGHQASEAPLLTEADKMALTDAVAGLAGEIVEDPGDDATLYQRLGRRPGLELLVTSWLAEVTADATLSGFFAGADDMRMRTCLVRQLASLDGPAVYGAEVTGTPCQAMAAAHAGVTNAAMGEAPITAGDFVAMLGHLATALSGAEASEADAGALAAMLEPLCVEIAVDAGACPGATQVQVLEAVDVGGPIEDGSYDGTMATMLCQTLTAAATGLDVVAAVEVEVGVDTGHAGDLTIKVVAPGGETVTLVSRPGFAEAADDGAGCSGDNSNLVGAAPLRFHAGGAKDAELMGDSLDTDGVICQDDGACSYTPNPGAATGADLASLTGTAAPGDWQVCVGDSCGGFTATLQVVRLDLTRTL